MGISDERQILDPPVARRVCHRFSFPAIRKCNARAGMTNPLRLAVTGRRIASIAPGRRPKSAETPAAEQGKHDQHDQDEADYADTAATVVISAISIKSAAAEQ
jgi:hypothetical protein